MAGFSDVHSEAERDILERGLKPLRIVFTLHLHEVKAPRNYRDKPIVIACERKKQIAATQPKRRAEGTENDVVAVDENIALYLVLARRGNYPHEDFTETRTASGGTPLPGFETAMAQITLRLGTLDGTVLDCVSLNLANFVTGRHSLSRTELALQLGGTLGTTVETQIFDEKTQDDSFAGEEAGSLKENGSNEKQDELVTPKLQPGPESLLPQVSRVETDRSILDDDNHASDDESSENTSKTVGVSEGDEVDNPPVKEPRVQLLKQLDDEDRLLSISTIDTECAGQEENDENEPFEENKEDSKDTKEDKDDGFKKSDLRSRISLRKTGEEYSTLYEEGTWVEDAAIVEVETPRKLVFWSIHGPEEYESDDDDSDNEGLPRKHNAMTVSTTKPGPPAKPGKMSVLQKSVMTSNDPSPPYVMDLGHPFSLLRCTVLEATKFLVHDIQYIDEPALSDSDGLDGNDEDDYSTASDTTSEVSEDDLQFAKLQSNKIRQLDDIQEEPDNAGGEVAGDVGDGRSEGVEATGNVVNDRNNRVDLSNIPSMGDTEEERVAELTFQLREMEKYIRQLQEELKAALLENTKLSSKMEAVQGGERSTDGSSRKSSLRSQSSEADGELETKDEERKRSHYSDVTIASVSDGTKEYIELLQRELEAEQEKSTASQKEHERLLLVIEKLNSELDREPGAADVVKELSEAKLQLAIERGERQKLERAVSKLRGSKQTKDCKGGKKKNFFGLPGGKSKTGKSSSSISKKKEGNSDDDDDSPKSILI